MTAHRHVLECYDVTDYLETRAPLRLVCSQPGWAREDLELHAPEDDVARQYAGDMEPAGSALVVGCGCLAVALLIVAALFLWLAAPRSAETKVPVDVSGISSARLSGAPQAPSPAVALEATSEGLPRPTSSMPATTSSRIRGLATWYCGSGSACTAGHSPGELVAAIDPGVGFHRGERIRVTAGDRSVVVRIVDVCACAGDRIVDLSRAAFARLADPGRGVIAVSIEKLGATPTLPPTDTAP